MTWSGHDEGVMQGVSLVSLFHEVLKLGITHLFSSLEVWERVGNFESSCTQTFRPSLHMHCPVHNRVSYSLLIFEGLDIGFES